MCVQNEPFKATSSIFNPFWLHFFILNAFTDFLSYMTLKLKSTTNELWKGWKLAWYHHFTHIACAKTREGYGKNEMHFMYKTDNLVRCIRVSYGNSSVTKGFQFLNLFELQTFCVFKMHYSKPHHLFSTLSDFICYFSCIYFILSYKTMKLKSIWNKLWKGWKLAWNHHFTHIACARK